MAKRRRGFFEEDILLLFLFLFGAMAVIGAMAVSVGAGVLDVATEPTPTATPSPTPTATAEPTPPTITPTVTPTTPTSAVTVTPGPPDLVASLNTAGPPSVNTEDRVEVPIEVVVRNQGGSPAGIFKVAIEYTGGSISPSSTFVVPFTVLGQSDSFYPFTDAPLAAQMAVTFEGTVTFHPAERGVTVSITATVDSCAGEEVVPEYCRVEERDEGNNASNPLSVPLPSPAPTPTDTTPPEQVMALLAGPGGGSGEVQLLWDANLESDGVFRYNIYRSTTEGGPYESVLDPVSNLQDPALPTGTRGFIDSSVSGAHWYVVSAEDLAGNEGMMSDEACGAPIGDSCPAVVE